MGAQPLAGRPVWLDLCAVEKPGIIGHHPMNMIRRYTSLQQEQDCIDAGLPTTDDDVGAKRFHQIRQPVNGHHGSALSHFVLGPSHRGDFDVHICGIDDLSVNQHLML